MGSSVVPLLVEHVHKGSLHLAAALSEITSDDPPRHGQGPLATKDAWTGWGQQHGHLGGGCGRQMRVIAAPGTVGEPAAAAVV